MYFKGCHIVCDKGDRGDSKTRSRALFYGRRNSTGIMRVGAASFILTNLCVILIDFK